MRKWNAERDTSTRATLGARARSGQGMSLVEATIILMVLAILTAVIAPSAGDYLSDARNVKAKEDVESVAMAIMRLQRDYGRKKLTHGNDGDIALLVSGTDDGVDGSVTNTELDAQPGAKALASGVTTWATTSTSVVTVSMDSALVTNTAGFTPVSFSLGGGPRSGLGWRGPYLTGSLGLDPWGARYQASIGHYGASDNSTNRALVLSAGTNGVVETTYTGGTGIAGGDDVIYVIAGSTR